MRASVRACVFVCVCACVRACVCVCACVDRTNRNEGCTEERHAKRIIG